jgi:hypothetical protein
MPSILASREYWLRDFQITGSDLELLHEYVLTHEEPQTSEELATQLVIERVTQQAARRAIQARNELIYQPRETYKKGQKLVFPALGGVVGKVVDVRPGRNTDLGDFEVIRVNFDGHEREFAADFKLPHVLNESEEELDAEGIAREYAPVVASRLAERLEDDADWVRYGAAWMLQGLLPEIHEGHVNLAEAVIITEQKALPPGAILKELDLITNAGQAVQEFALNLALSKDTRFHNVGAHEAPLWQLSDRTAP